MRGRQGGPFLPEKEESPPTDDEGAELPDNPMYMEVLGEEGAKSPTKKGHRNKGTINHYFSNVDSLRKVDKNDESGRKKRERDDDEVHLPTKKHKSANIPPEKPIVITFQHDVTEVRLAQIF